MPDSQSSGSGMCEVPSSFITLYFINLVIRPERKRYVERPRLRWKNNISMTFMEFELGTVDGLRLAQHRNLEINLPVS